MNLATPGTLDFDIGMSALMVAVALAIGIAVHLWRSNGTSKRPQPQASDDPPAPPCTVDMVSFAELQAEYERRRAACEQRNRELSERESELLAADWENASPDDILARDSIEERKNLAVICGLDPNSSVAAIVEEICRSGSHSIAAWVRGLRGRSRYAAYREVAWDAANKVRVKGLRKEATIAEIEVALVESAWRELLAKATPEERARLIKQLGAEKASMARNVGVAASTMALANLSGFGVYVMASTLVGGLTSVLGVTLPFAAYTGMSSIIATLTGPVGWFAMLAGGLVVMGRVNYRRTVPAVMHIGGVRSRLIVQRDLEIAHIQEQFKELGPEKKVVQEIRDVLDRMLAKGLEAIPRTEIPL